MTYVVGYIEGADAPARNPADGTHALIRRPGRPHCQQCTCTVPSWAGCPPFGRLPSTRQPFDQDVPDNLSDRGWKP